ncbi:MAG: efflux transporter outer membrane subunit [Novosphingobium sp.]|nr:efflux transporter outer membrane subunit [Novosphingobium sp.]
MSQRPIFANLRVALAAAALLVPGCVPAPGPHTATQLRAAQTIAESKSIAGSEEGEWPSEEWWRGFGDPQLDTLIAEGLENSPDLAASMARFRRASGLATEDGASLYPQVDVDGSIYQDRRSLNNGFGSGIKQFLPRGWRTGGDVSASVGLDLDVWGRNRAKLAAATSEARAAAIDADAARLMLATAIADAYADLGQLFAQRDVRKAALDIRSASQQLVASREANGLETRGSLRQADAQVATARVLLTQADEEIALRRHQIAALLGAGPDRGTKITRPELTSARVADVPEGVTTGLIGRRPDIMSARERAQAAARRIDVARADFFPAIRLDALIGLQTLGLDTLFRSDSTFGRAGPAINLPIFRGGALRGRYNTASATFDEAVAEYDSTVVAAYRQLADIVTSRSFTGRKLVDARDAQTASEEAYTIAKLRYEGGLSTYLEVLTVEDRLLDTRLAVAGLETGAHLLDIALIRALGGGFGKPGAGPAKDVPNG